MWRWFVFSLVIWNTTSSQPLTQEPDHAQPPTQPPTECCPCPGSIITGLDSAVSASDPRSVAVDDCPCRLRGVDSEGSSTIFLPRAVHPVRDFIKPDVPKEDQKPLLHPEVGLASSVLETLREATDEEYQEALARDAARNTAKAAEPTLGDTHEADKNVVTIILDSDSEGLNDALPEASNAQETRCAFPLGRSNLGQVRDEPLRGIFKVDPKVMRKKIADIDSGASDMRENVVALNRERDRLKLKTDANLLKLFPNREKSFENSKIKNLFNLRNNNVQIISKGNENSTKKPGIVLNLNKIPDFKLSPTLKKLSESSSSKPLGLTVPKLNLIKSKNNHNILDLSDSNTSPSNINEEFMTITKGRNVPKFSLPSLLSRSHLNTPRHSPFTIKNLLKLKDVEIVPPRTNKVTIELPTLKPPTNSWTKKAKLTSLQNVADCDTTAKASDLENNFQFIPRGKKGKTEILDVLPSASENNEFVVENGNITEEEQNDQSEATNDDSRNFSNEQIVNDNGEEIKLENEASADEHTVNSEMTDSEVNDVSISSQQSSKVPEDGVEDIEDNNYTEVIINEEGDPEIDEIVINIDNDSTNNETNFDPEEGEQFFETQEGQDLEIDGQDFSHSVAQGIDGQDFEDVIHENEEILESDTLANPNSFILEKEAEETDSFSDTSNHDEVMVTAPNDSYPEFESTGEENNPEIGSYEEEDKLESHTPPKSKVLPNLKESIVLRFKDLHNPNSKVLSISRTTKPESSKMVMDPEVSSSLNESAFPEDENEEFFQQEADEKSAEFTETGNVMSNEDLQNMADTLLNENKPELGIHKSKNCGCKANASDDNSNEESDATSDSVDTVSQLDMTSADSDSNTMASTHHTVIIETTESPDSTSNVLPEQEIDTSQEQEMESRHTDEENTCSNNDLKLASSEESENSQEMDVGASEPIGNIFTRTEKDPTLSQQIVQPSSLFDNNMFRPPGIPGIPDLRQFLSGSSPLPPLPTLDEISSSITNLFGGNERASHKEEELMSSEFDPDTDCTGDSPVMSSDASSTSSRSSLPAFKNPLENINLDIFQLSPLSRSSPFSSKIPTLNLNSFKAKLAVPKSLDLKPVKLQSSLGKNGGLLGATLTFGPSKKTSNERRPLLRSSVLNRKPDEILGNSLGNLPSFDEVRDKMRSNAVSLLNSPLEIPKLQPFDTQSFTDNIRSHTENTVRNLQHSLASTLNEARGSGGGKLAKPKVDLLEMVTEAHDDMKDKLHAIHIDLQDRITTLHDNIKEQAKLPSLNLPTLDIVRQEPLFGRLNSPSMFRASQPTKRRKTQKDVIMKVNKPSSKTVRIGSTQSKQAKQQTELRPFKMSKAASSLTPKSVEVPKLTTTSTKPPFANPLQRSPVVQLRKSNFVTNQETTNQPKLRTPIQNGRGSSMSARPISSLFVSSPKSSPASSTIQSSKRNERPLTKLPTSKFSRPRYSSQDSTGFASEVRPLAVKPTDAVAKTAEFKSATLTPLENPSYVTPTVKSPPSKISSLSSEKSPPLKKPLLQLPKPTESPLLTKLRQSLKSKSLKTSQTKASSANVPSKIGNIGSVDDMARSASKNNAVALSKEPLKENVSYKCKMVCYRE